MGRRGRSNKVEEDGKRKSNKWRKVEIVCRMEGGNDQVEEGGRKEK